MKFLIPAIVALISISLSAQPTVTSFSPFSATPGSTITLNGTNFGSNVEDNLRQITVRPWGAKEFALMDDQIGIIIQQW